MEQANRPIAAAAVIFTAMAILSLVDSFFSRISEVAGLWQFHLLRACIALPLMFVISRLTGIAIIPTRFLPVFARAFCVSGSMICYFGSLAFLTVPQAAAGLFTAPIWVLVFTTVLLRQPIGPRRLAAVGCGFAGAMLVLDVFSTGVSVGFILPIMGGILYALGAIATRTWCEGETALSLLAAFFVCMIFWGLGGIAVLEWMDVEAPAGTAGLMLRSWGTLGADATFWLFIQAIGSVAGIYALTRGYQLGEASYVAVFEYSFLAFAVFWGIALFGQQPGLLELVGIGLIICSGLLIAVSPAARRQAA